MDSYQQDEQYLRAMGLYLSGQWAQAAEEFTQLDSRFPNESFFKLLRGNIEYSRGHLDASVQLYNETIALSPDFGNAYYKLGVCYYRMGKLKEALEAFTRVVELKNQSHAMAQYFVGLINFFLGEDDEASAAFAQFHSVSGESKIASFYLAQLKIKRKEFDEALPLLEELVAVTPNFAEVHYMLGTVQYGLHNNTQAIKCFQRALEINPGDERSKSKLALLTEVQWP